MKAKFYSIFLTAAGLILLINLAIVIPVRAQEGTSGEVVIIERGQVVEDDLYVGANQFVLRGTINGDLYVVGGTITIEPTGVVEGDLGAAGQSIVIDGQVNGDARLAGAALRLGGQVSEDLIGASYSLETLEGSSVGGNLTFFGSQAILAGDIAGNVRVEANGVELAGATIGGDVHATVEETSNPMPISPFIFMPNMPQIPTVNNGLTVRAGTEIGGDLTYVSGTEALIPPGAVTGEVNRQVPQITTEEEQERTQQAEAAAATSSWWRNNLGNLLALLVVGLLLVWFAPRFVQNGAAALQAKPLPSLGWGIVAIIAFFLALLALTTVVVVLAVMLGLVTLGELVGPTVFGGMLAGGGLIYAFFMAVSYISKILVSYLTGRWILSRIKPDWALRPALPLILGVVIFAILVAIPYLGTLVTWLAILFGLGAIWLLGLERFWRRPGQGAAVYTPPPATPAD
jgi:cytoskeletal protein CcmA (bactofilin family)